ncbi:NADH-quinone oxidoreductase subunit I [Rickettsiales endosymbiont of Paramecium tredecaurelia]|uniref:NADH-quinone oxidoreductase subunit NuoI n=1 Tax=Candidatus Sarmatiella mevalonica TaxID=2770581 RepID=UPI0019236A22|nr:NADH-quinone oxidoreductase subunit NuoI [Candidatus Sarmatiella mevalonica]MBL3285167.1 NADH-quinone oxidoreductase subunit I [Candidatus Sarmatiella mevalonica]
MHFYLQKIRVVVGRIVLFDILHGLLLTISYLFKKKVTVRYPLQKNKLSNKFRGEHALRTYSNGKQRCVGCKLCSAICPASAIRVESGENKEGKRCAITYEIDMTKCIYCGLCQEACPVDAIVQGKNHEFSCTSKTLLLYDQQKLLNNKATHQK